METATSVSEGNVLNMFRSFKHVLVCITSYHVYLEVIKILLSHKYIYCEPYSFEIYFSYNFMLKYRITISLREFTKALSLNICVPVSLTNQNNPANIYLFKSSNRSNRKSDEVCSNLMINTPEQCHWYVACIFTVTFEYISKHNVLYC